MYMNLLIIFSELWASHWCSMESVESHRWPQWKCSCEQRGITMVTKELPFSLDQYVEFCYVNGNDDWGVYATWLLCAPPYKSFIMEILSALARIYCRCEKSGICNFPLFLMPLARYGNDIDQSIFDRLWAVHTAALTHIYADEVIILQLYH